MILCYYSCVNLISAVIVGLAAVAAKRTPAPLPVLQITIVDFVYSYPVTDGNQFYRNLDGTPQSPATGNGLYPSHEFDIQQPIQTVPYVVQRHGIPMLVEVTFHNTINAAIYGTWSCDSADFNRTSCTPSQDSP